MHAVHECKIQGKKYSKYKIKSKNYGVRTSKYKVKSENHKSTEFNRLQQFLAKILLDFLNKRGQGGQV